MFSTLNLFLLQDPLFLDSLTSRLRFEATFRRSSLFEHCAHSFQLYPLHIHSKKEVFRFHPSRCLSSASPSAWRCLSSSSTCSSLLPRLASPAPPMEERRGRPQLVCFAFLNLSAFRKRKDKSAPAGALSVIIHSAQCHSACENCS